MFFYGLFVSQKLGLCKSISRILLFPSERCSAQAWQDNGVKWPSSTKRETHSYQEWQNLASLTVRSVCLSSSYLKKVVGICHILLYVCRTFFLILILWNGFSYQENPDDEESAELAEKQDAKKPEGAIEDAGEGKKVQ